MLLIVDLTSKGDGFHPGALQQVDSALLGAGFKKEVHSVIKPGKQVSLTYDGPSVEKSRVEEILKPLAERNGFSFSFDVEDSVRFP